MSTATRWYGTTRIPRGLAKAGFDVALLTPRNSLAEKSRFVGSIGYLPDNATPRQWLDTFGKMVADVSPRIIILCDDTAFRLLSWLVRSLPNLATHLQEPLTQLVQASLGDPSYYDASTDKTVLPALAESLGVRVPAYTLVAGMSDAERFAARYGYPVVLKRAHGFAGQGVAMFEPTRNRRRACHVRISGLARSAWKERRALPSAGLRRRASSVLSRRRVERRAGGWLGA